LEEPTATKASRAAHAAAATSLPVLPPLAALFEIAVLYSILMLGDWLHPGVELSDIRPHPFWIPVLLLSLQYGTVSGLIAAAAAIGLTASSGFPEQGPSETYFTYLLKIWIEPTLWLGAAVLIGQFRMRQIARKQELIFQVQELSSQRAAIADYARNLRAHCNALERQIAGRREGDPILVLKAVTEAYEAGVARGDAAIGETLAGAIGAALPGAQASLYTADAPGLRLAAATAGGDTGKTPALIIQTDPLYRAIVGDGVAVSVLTREGEQCLGGKGLVALPICAAAVTGSRRRIIGMLKIEAISPSALDDACLPALAAIGHAFVPALEARLNGARPAAMPLAAEPAALMSAPAQRLWRHLRWWRGPQPGTAVAAADQPAPQPTRRASSVTR